MKFQELSDKQWEIIQEHLPKPAKTGRPRADDRMILNGIIYVLTTGCRWQDMPKLFGDDSTANLRLRKWQQNRIWKNILSDVIKSSHQSGKAAAAKDIHRLINHCSQKRGNCMVMMVSKRF